MNLPSLLVFLMLVLFVLVFATVVIIVMIMVAIIMVVMIIVMAAFAPSRPYSHTVFLFFGKLTIHIRVVTHTHHAFCAIQICTTKNLQLESRF